MARRRLLLAGLLLLCATALSSAADSAAEDPLIEQVVGGGDENELELNAEAHFASFVRRFGKSYRDADEHAYRLSVFKANLRRARRHQRLDPSAVHGVTKFSDLTPAEFRERFLGLRRRPRRGFLEGFAGSEHKAPILPTDGLPADFDWRDHGARNVLQFGDFSSCSMLLLQGSKKFGDFSSFQLPFDAAFGKFGDFSSCDAGCNGGLMTTAFSYLQKAGGLESEKD